MSDNWLDLLLNQPTEAEMTEAQRIVFQARRKAVRDAILEAQRTNANRDAKALRAETAWLKKHRRQQ